MGYYVGDDPAQIDINVTYVVKAQYTLLNSTHGIMATFDTDRGMYYDYSVSVQLYLFIIIYPLIYFSLALWSCYLLVLEVRLAGFNARASIQILICLILTLIRKTFLPLFCCHQEGFNPQPV